MVQSINGDIGNLEARVKNLEKDVNCIERDLDELKQKFAEWQGGLSMAKWLLAFVGFSGILNFVVFLVKLLGRG